MPVDQQNESPAWQIDWWITCRWLLAATALCLLLECIVIWRSPVISRDGLGFIWYAQKLCQDPRAAIPLHDQHPGYPALIVSGQRMASLLGAGQTMTSWLMGARGVGALSGALSVAAIWLLAKRIFDPRVANVSALLFAVMPIFRQNASDALSDTPHLACYLFGIWLAVEGIERRRVGLFAAAGMVSGLGYWIRPEAATVALITALVALFWPRWRHQLGTRRAIQGAAAVSVAFTAVVVPLVALSGHVTGKLSHKQYFAAIQEQQNETKIATAPQRPATVPPADRLPTPGTRSSVASISSEISTAIRPSEQRNSRPLPTNAELLARTPWQIFSGAAYELVHEVLHALRYFLVIPLVWALFPTWRKRAASSAVAIIVVASGIHIVLLFVLYFLGGYISHRHVMPIVALAVPWIACGCIAWREWLDRLPVYRSHRWLAPAWCASLLALVLIPRALRPLNTMYQPLKQAGAYLDAHAESGTHVLANSHYIAFYCGTRCNVLADEQVPDVQSALAKSAHDPYEYVVLDYGCDESFEPEWIDELKADFEPVCRVDGTPVKSMHDVVVFRRRTADPHVATRPGAPSDTGSSPAAK